MVALVAGSALGLPTLTRAETVPASDLASLPDPSSAMNSAAAVLGIVASSSAPLVDGGDGRIFFPGDRGANVRLAAVAPAGLMPTFRVAPVPGWQVHQPAAGTDARGLHLSFVPGAPSLSVTTEFRDIGGALVASIDRTLTAGPPSRVATGGEAAAGTLSVSVPVSGSDAPTVPLSSLPADPEFLAARTQASPQVVDAGPASSSVATLVWVEQRFATPIVDRRLRIESSPVDPAEGCHAWKAVEERAIELASPLPEPHLPGTQAGPNVATAVARAPTWSAELGTPLDPTAPRSAFAKFPWEFELQRPAWRVGRLTIPLSADGCLRFKLVVGDALGRTAVLAWPDVALNRLALGGRVLPAFSGHLDLFRSGAFASQQHYTWCVGAAGQMMVSLITGQRSDPRSQPYFMAWAETHDWVDHSRWSGSDDEGLRSLLERFSGVRYEKVWMPDTVSAIRLAAVRMRLTGAPAEITVMDGKHAWVLHGFESNTDPLLDRQAVIRAVYVSGPLAPRAPQTGGFDPPTDTRLGPAALYHYLSPSGAGGPWKVVVPAPGPRGWAAGQPSSLGEVGLRWWPLNIFSELRALPDLRTADVSPIAPVSPVPAPTASPAPTAGATPDPLASPTPDPAASPTVDPTVAPTPDPTVAPTPDPTVAPTPDPTPDPTAAPTPDPTPDPTPAPTP